MARPQRHIKRLSYEHEDLSASPKTHVKKSGMCGWHPRDGDMWRQKPPGASWAVCPAYLIRSKATSDPASKQQNKANRNNSNKPYEELGCRCPC